MSSDKIFILSLILSNLTKLKFRKELEQRVGETKKQHNKRFRNENPYDKSMKINPENRMISFYDNESLLKALEIIKQCDVKFPKSIVFDVDDPIVFNNKKCIIFNTYGEKFVAILDYLITKGFQFRVHNEWGEVTREIK